MGRGTTWINTKDETGSDPRVVGRPWYDWSPTLPEGCSARGLQGLVLRPYSVPYGFRRTPTGPEGKRRRRLRVDP